jgi:hypothetical protein
MGRINDHRSAKSKRPSCDTSKFIGRRQGYQRVSPCFGKEERSRLPPIVQMWTCTWLAPSRRKKCPWTVNTYTFFKIVETLEQTPTAFISALRMREVFAHFWAVQNTEDDKKTFSRGMVTSHMALYSSNLSISWPWCLSLRLIQGNYNLRGDHASVSAHLFARPHYPSSRCQNDFAQSQFTKVTSFGSWSDFRPAFLSDLLDPVRLRARNGTFWWYCSHCRLLLTAGWFSLDTAWKWRVGMITTSLTTGALETGFLHI